MIEERKTINTNIVQNLFLENRNKLNISGVLKLFLNILNTSNKAPIINPVKVNTKNRYA